MKMAEMGIVFKCLKKLNKGENYCLFQDTAINNQMKQRRKVRVKCRERSMKMKKT
jgi:hypothetical protein